MPTAVGNLGAVAPEATVDSAIDGNGISGFDFDGEAEIKSIGTTVLAEHIFTAESRQFREGSAEFMLFIGIPHEVVVVADREAGDDAIGVVEPDRCFQCEANAPEERVGGMGIHGEVEGLSS